MWRFRASRRRGRVRHRPLKDCNPADRIRASAASSSASSQEGSQLHDRGDDLAAGHVWHRPWKDCNGRGRASSETANTYSIVLGMIAIGSLPCLRPSGLRPSIALGRIATITRPSARPGFRRDIVLERFATMLHTRLPTAGLGYGIVLGRIATRPCLAWIPRVHHLP